MELFFTLYKSKKLNNTFYYKSYTIGILPVYNIKRYNAIFYFAC